MISFIQLENNVLRQDLCTNCGACQNLCPYWKSFQGRTYGEFECNRTEGRCVSFCPRMKTDLASLRAEFFAAADITPELGPVKGLYLTRATAKGGGRAGSQHGGSMTALLQLALREGLLDAAVLSRSQGGLEPQPVLATTAGEIDACRGSSFQIPNSLALLNQALAENIYKKIAVVGTPCKTLAVYKMKAKPLPQQDNNADNIGLVFGLFCGWGLDWRGLSALAARQGLTDLQHLDIPPSRYHCLQLEGAGGQSLQVDLDQVYPLVRSNCHYCADLTAEFSDISVGGARSAEGWETDKGWNQVLTRTDKGAALLELAREQGVLEFRDGVDLEKLKRAAAGKKSNAEKRLREKYNGGVGYLGNR